MACPISLMARRRLLGPGRRLVRYTSQSQLPIAPVPQHQAELSPPSLSPVPWQESSRQDLSPTVAPERSGMASGGSNSFFDRFDSEALARFEDEFEIYRAMKREVNRYCQKVAKGKEGMDKMNKEVASLTGQVTKLSRACEALSFKLYGRHTGPPQTQQFTRAHRQREVMRARLGLQENEGEVK